MKEESLSLATFSFREGFKSRINIAGHASAVADHLTSTRHLLHHYLRKGQEFTYLKNQEYTLFKWLCEIFVQYLFSS